MSTQRTLVGQVRCALRLTTKSVIVDTKMNGFVWFWRRILKAVSSTANVEGMGMGRNSYRIFIKEFYLYCSHKERSIDQLFLYIKRNKQQQDCMTSEISAKLFKFSNDKRRKEILLAMYIKSKYSFF